MRTIIVCIAVILAATAAAAPVAAQPASPAAQPAPPAGQPSYHSPMRLQCEDELRKDLDWYGTLKEQCYAAIQSDAVNYATTNQRHVFLAYAAFWLLTLGFVVHLWRRQQALRGEVVRLERELARALRDEPGGAIGS